MSRKRIRGKDKFAFCTFDHVATASNGWHAIVVNGQVGWVSGKYSRMI